MHILAAMLVTCPVYSPAVPDKAAFQRVYDKLSNAFEHKDAKAYFSILAPDFRQEMKGRPKMTAAQIKADFTRQMNTLSDVHWPRKVLSVTPAGGGFDVKVRGHMTGLIHGPDGKLHQMVVDGLSLDHWNKSMKIESANVQSFQMTIDGKKLGTR